MRSINPLQTALLLFEMILKRVIFSGDGSLVDFSLTITPYPFLLVTQPLILYAGGEISFTEESQKIANNMSFELFNENLKQIIYIDYSSQPLSDWIINE